MLKKFKVTNGWFRKFLERQPTLSLRKGDATANIACRYITKYLVGIISSSTPNRPKQSSTKCVTGARVLTSAQCMAILQELEEKKKKEQEKERKIGKESRKRKRRKHLPKKKAEERKPKEEAAKKKADDKTKKAAAERETRSNKRQKNTVSCPASKECKTSLENYQSTSGSTTAVISSASVTTKGRKISKSKLYMLSQFC